MIVTGIGTREVPDPDKQAAEFERLASIVQEIGELAGVHGWLLRSGGADGMDSLFEYFWKGPKEIYIAWNGFNHRYHGIKGAVNITDEATLKRAQYIVANVHPAWGRLKRGAKMLHTRNVFQALGDDVNSPSDICVYYANQDIYGNVQGGTRTAVEICRANGVPTYNLKITEDVINLQLWLDQWKK